MPCLVLPGTWGTAPQRAGCPGPEVPPTWRQLWIALVEGEDPGERQMGSAF